MAFGTRRPGGAGLILFLVAIGSLIAAPVPPALAQSGGGAAAPADLRQIQQALHDIHARSRTRKWAETEDLLLRIKKTFVRCTPQLLTRISPEELSHFSYALATLEEGAMAHDVAQMDQGLQLSKAATAQLQSRFPDEVTRELDDLRQAVERAAGIVSEGGDVALAQDYLEDVAAARKRLDNACLSYARESWVHFGLTAETFARAVRAHNPTATRESAAVAVRDLHDIQDRIAQR